MAQRILDRMDDLAGWEALAPDGITPSAEIALAIDRTRWRDGDDHASLGIRGSTAAAGHLVRRAIATVDASAFDELRWWASSTRRAEGRPGSPCFLEVRLGGGGVGVDDPANGWARLLPFDAPGAWQQHRLGLADLPAQVRGAVTLLQLRCVDAAAPFEVNLDDALWVRPELLSDVDAALVAALHERLSLGGRRVPALLAVAGAPPETTPPTQPPYLLVTNYDIRFSDERTRAAQVVADLSPGGGALLRPGSFAYDLYYQVEAVARTRTDEAALLELVSRSLPPRGSLLVAGDRLPCEAVFVPAHARIGGSRAGKAQRWFRVAARQEVGAAERVPPVTSVEIAADAARA